MESMNDRSREISVASSKQNIAHRASPRREPEADGSIIWDIEYQQNPKDGYWGPRGRFEEREGKFYLGDRVFDAAYMALNHKAYFG